MLEITKDNFEKEVLQSEQPVAIDLWAPWCGPCRAITPIMEEIASDFSGKAKVVKLNVDDNPAIAAKYRIMSIPTILFFKNGNVEAQIVGLVPKAKIANKINELL